MQFRAHDYNPQSLFLILSSCADPVSRVPWCIFCCDNADLYCLHKPRWCSPKPLLTEYHTADVVGERSLPGGMASEVSELQKNLLSALLDSGISRDVLVTTIDTLHAKRQEKEIVNTVNQVEQQCKPEPVSREILLSESCSSGGESPKDYSPSEEIPESSQSPVVNRGSVVDHLLR